MSFPIARACAVFILPVLAFCLAAFPAQAGPGHDHGHDHGNSAAARSKGPTNPRVTMVSDAFELVGILRDHKLTLYLDRRADTSPIPDAEIKLTIDGATGTTTRQPDGSYLYENTALDAHAKFEVVADINSAGTRDLLVGTLDNSEIDHGHDDNAYDHDHAIHHQGENGSHTHRSLHDYVGMLFSVQTLVGLGLGLIIGVLLRSRVRPARTAAVLVGLGVGLAGVLGTADIALAGPGHDHDQADHAHASSAKDIPGRMDDGKIFVPKPTQRLLEIRTQVMQPSTTRRSERLIGRVIADPNQNGLVQSSIRGRIKPAKGGFPVLGQGVKAGDTLALVEPAFEPIDASDVRQTAGDLEQRIAVLKARLARRSQLVRKNVASRASLQDIEIELEGLRARRQQLDESRSKPEVLVAPVTGVIADVRVTSGQVIASADTLFHVVNPESLWVEALAFNPKLRLSSEAMGYADDNKPLKLSFVGRSRTLQQQATVLQYRIDTPPRSLSIGAPLTVMVETGDPVTGLVLPKDALAEAPNGQSVAYVRDAPEFYRAVPVRTEALDGRRVRVVAGLSPGDQVVVQGASLISQIK